MSASRSGQSRRRGQGEGSVYRRANGYWAGILDLGYVEGRRHRRTVSGKTRAEVLSKLERLRRDHQLGLDLSVQPRTVGDWLEDWLTTIKNCDGTRPSTLARYRGVIDHHLKPGLGRHRLDRLTPRDVQAFLASRHETVAPATVVKLHGVLRAALSDAERLDLVPRNVAKSVRGPSLGRRERDNLSIEEARRLLQFAADDRFEGVFVIALTMGLRRGEILGLRWSDIDADTGVLWVRQAVQRVNGGLQLVEPKTHRSRRALPIPGLALGALDRQRARQAAERLAAGPVWQDNGLVFASVIGTLLEPRNVNRHFERIRDEAGLSWVRLHDLRHACATFLLAQGVEPRTVMEILGHSTIRLTMDTYSHVLPDRLQAAAEAMNQTLG